MKRTAALLVFLLAAPFCRAEPPTDADYTFTDALAAYKTERYGDAARLCQKAIDTPPANAPASERQRFLVLQGRIDTGKEDFAAGETVLKQAIQLDPSNVAAHRALGDLYFRERHYAEARPAYLDAQHYLPGKPDPDISLQLLYCALGQKDKGEALRLNSTLSAFDDQTPAAYFAQAALARTNGDEATAERTLQTAATVYGPQVYAQYARDYLFLFATAE